MPKRRVHKDQLDLRRHLRAAERQQAADELEERIRELKSKIRPYQILVEAARQSLSNPSSWWQWDRERREQRRYERERRAVLEEIDYLQWRRLQLGGHRLFRLPVVAGCGMGDALRREQAKEAR